MIVFPLTILAVGTAVTGVALVLMARAILRPPRMGDGKALYVLKRLSPADLGMRFEPMRFEIRDQQSGRGLKIAAWWIRHPSSSDKTVVLIHGNSDAKVGAIAWAPTWQQLGYHILAIDLRAHGESGGKYTTAGVLERHDVEQVLNQIRAQRPRQTQQVALFGASMGAVVALAVAESREDLSALVLDCPFADFAHAVRAHAKLLELPLQSLLPLAMRIGAWMSGADFGLIQPLRWLANVRCPVLVVQCGDDPFVPADDARAIEQALTSAKPGSGYRQCWRLEAAGHLQALAADPQQYRQRIADFLRCARTADLHAGLRDNVGG